MEFPNCTFFQSLNCEEEPITSHDPPSLQHHNLLMRLQVSVLAVTSHSFTTDMLTFSQLLQILRSLSMKRVKMNLIAKQVRTCISCFMSFPNYYPSFSTTEYTLLDTMNDGDEQFHMFDC